MSGTVSTQTWVISLALAALVVAIAAALLLTIIFLARRIGRLARTALGVVQAIDANTRPVWSIAATNQAAGDLLEGARAIDRNAWAVVDALSHVRKDDAA